MSGIDFSTKWHCCIGHVIFVKRKMAAKMAKISAKTSLIRKIVEKVKFNRMNANSTAIYHISTMPYPFQTLTTPINVCQLPKNKMAYIKQEVDCFSGMEYDIQKIPTAIPTFSTMLYPKILSP